MDQSDKKDDIGNTTPTDSGTLTVKFYCWGIFYLFLLLILRNFRPTKLN